MSREDKNWLTREVRNGTYFNKGIALGGYYFDFSDVLKRYFVKQYGHISEYYAVDIVKQYGHISEYYAVDKTALRSVLYGRIEDIVELN